MEDMDTLFFDTETTGLELFKKDKMFAMTWAMNDGPVHYSEDSAPLIDAIKQADQVVAHNITFDANTLRHDIDITYKPMDDTMIRAKLIDEHKFNYDLDSLTGMKDHIVDELAKLFGGKATKNVQMKNLHKAPRELVERYAKQDIVALRHLYHTQKDLPPVHSLEKKLIPVICKMEQTGIRVDIDAAEIAVDKVTKIIDKAQVELNTLVGRAVNVNSSPQMQALFEPKEIDGGKFRLIDGTIAERTKAGKAQINKECLQSMQHPAAGHILKIRRYKKTRDTFLVSQILENNVNGRVHPHFNQIGTVTGRLSCTGPNLQAVPKRDPEMKQLLRSLFLPEDGAMLLRCDYDQSDIRSFAHYVSTAVENHPLIEAYTKDPDMDLHQFAAEMMNEPRGTAKSINLAMVFSMGGGKLALMLDLPYTERVGRNGKTYIMPGQEAQELFERYHTAVPGAKEMNNKAAAVALSRGHVVSILGRHLHFPGGKFTHKAAGYLYQAWTADLIKGAMVATDGIAPLHLSVHDELLFSITEEATAWKIREAMQEVLSDKTKIPIRTSPEVGENWANTKPL